jgi:hypothetical protein
MEDVNTVHPPCCVHPRRTQHTAHAAVTASHLISCSCSCFPSLLQRLEVGLQPAVFASQGRRTVALWQKPQRRRLPSSQFPVPTLHRSLAGWADRLDPFYPIEQIVYRWLAKVASRIPYWKSHHFACRVWRGVKSFLASCWRRREHEESRASSILMISVITVQRSGLVWRRFSYTGKHGETGLPGREITLSRLLPNVTMIQQIMLHASCFNFQAHRRSVLD